MFKMFLAGLGYPVEFESGLIFVKDDDVILTKDEFMLIQQKLEEADEDLGCGKCQD